MSEYLLRDTKLGISRARESSYNAIAKAGGSQLATDFFSLVLTNKPLLVPGMEKVGDGNKVGTQNEFALTQRNSYISMLPFAINDEVNFEIFSVLLAQAMGGTVTKTVDSPAVGINTHDIIMLPSSSTLQLPSRNLITQLGGDDFVGYGFCVDSFQVQQSGAAVPTYTCNMVGSGKHKVAAGFSIGAADPTKVHYAYGAAVNITYNDGSARTPGTDGKIKSWQFNLNNALRRDDRRIQDPLMTANTPASGAYVNRLFHGQRSATAQVVVTLDNNMNEWTDMMNNQVVTSLTFSMKGDIISSANQYEVQITLPRCYLTGVVAREDFDDATLTLDFMPVKDSVSGGLFTAKVINAMSVLDTAITSTDIA